MKVPTHTPHTPHANGQGTLNSHPVHGVQGARPPEGLSGNGVCAMTAVVTDQVKVMACPVVPWRWWQCSCGHEVRADQLRCPLPWCRRSRSRY